MGVIIVGGANIDLTATTNEKYIPKDSNVGKVRATFGGVGRNIAQTVALLGGRVSFVSAFSSDPMTVALVEDLHARGIDTSLSYFDRGVQPSYYVSINDRDGEMVSAVAQMDGMSYLTGEYLKDKLEGRAFRAIAFDCNLSEDAISYLLSRKEPAFCDGVSSTKVLNLKKALLRGGRLFMLKVNKIEAEALTDQKISDKETLFRALKGIKAQNAENVFITLGRFGTGYALGDKLGFITAPKARVSNVSGGGDSFISGLIGAFLHEKPMEEWGLYGLAASKIAIESDGAAADGISFHYVENTVENIKNEVDYE